MHAKYYEVWEAHHLAKVNL